MTSSKKPKILILGTFHMGETGDLIQTEVDGLTTDNRQKEILDVVEKLLSYSPTKVALEVEIKYTELMNQRYRTYLNENDELGMNEVYQLGFRIAERLNHKEIYCIDWMEEGVATKGFGEVYEWAKDNQTGLFKEIFGLLDLENKTDYQTILEMYQDCNKDEQIKKLHALNVNIARIKDKENYIGLDWLLWWYQRNLIMFSNLADIQTSDDDRVLLIVGSSHVEILSNIVRESGLFEIESIDEYLY